MNNLSSYCGIVDAKIRASDKDLPVSSIHPKNEQKIPTKHFMHTGKSFSEALIFASSKPQYDKRLLFIDL